MPNKNMGTQQKESKLSKSSWEKRKNYSRQLNRRLKPLLAKSENTRSTLVGTTTNKPEGETVSSAQAPISGVEPQIQNTSNVQAKPAPWINQKRKRSNSFTISLNKTLDDIDRPEIKIKKREPQIKLRVKGSKLVTPKPQKRKASAIESSVTKKVRPDTPTAIKTFTFGNLSASAGPRQNNLRLATVASVTTLRRATIASKPVTTVPVKKVAKQPVTKVAAAEKTPHVPARQRYHVPARVDTGLKNKKVTVFRPVTPRVKNPSNCKKPPFTVTNLNKQEPGKSIPVEENLPVIDLDNPEPGPSGVRTRSNSPKENQSVRRNSFTVTTELEHSSRKRRSASLFLPNDPKLIKTPASILKKSRRSKDSMKAIKSMQFEQVTNSEEDLNDEVFEDNVENIAPPKTPARKIPKRSKSVSFQIPCGRRSSSGRAIRKTPKKDLSLRMKLEDWLDNHGHSASHLRHVHCFGFNPSDIKKSTPTATRNKMDDQFGASPMLGVRKDASHSTNCATGGLSTNDVYMKMSAEELEKTLLQYKEEAENGSKRPHEICLLISKMGNIYPAVNEMSLFWELTAYISETLGTKQDAMAVLCEALNFNVKPAEEFKALVKNYLEPSPEKLHAEESKSVKESNEVEFMITDTTPTMNTPAKRRRNASITNTPLNESGNKTEATMLKFVSAKNRESFREILDYLGDSALPLKDVLTPVRRSARLAHSEKKSHLSAKDIPSKKRSSIATVPNLNM